MSTKDGRELKRFGGRWVREGEQFQERNKTLKAILSRFWYLLVPFLGIMWAHDSYVRPVEEDVKSVKNRERAAVLDQQDEIRAQVSGVQSDMNAVESELDTLYLPQIEFYGDIHDSLKQQRLIYDETLPRAKARVDSLTLLMDNLTAELEELSETYRQRSETLASLRDWRAVMQDSIIGLDSLIALRTDELYRKQQPLEYRRKEALFTGEGQYPRRDENPPREGGQ